MACTRVISMHCAAVSRGIKKRAIFSHRGVSRGRRDRKCAPSTRGRCSFRECFLIPVHVGTRARVYCRAERTSQGALFLFSPCIRADSFLLTRNRISVSPPPGSLRTLLCGWPPPDSRETVHAEQEFRGKPFFPPVRTFAGRDRTLVTTSRPRIRCYEEMAGRKRNELA